MLAEPKLTIPTVLEFIAVTDIYQYSPQDASGEKSVEHAFGVSHVALFIGFFLAFCVFHCIGNLHSASTILSLDYEEASKGLTPNRTRFNIFEIRSGEVMERLIGYAGLEGKISPDELSRCVSVQATHDKSVSGSVNYISTSFVVRFTNNGAIAGRSAEDMLSLLCKAYREYFVEHYGYNHSILSFDVGGVDELRFLTEKIRQVEGVMEIERSTG